MADRRAAGLRLGRPAAKRLLARLLALAGCGSTAAPGARACPQLNLSFDGGGLGNRWQAWLRRRLAGERGSALHKRHPSHVLAAWAAAGAEAAASIRFGLGRIARTQRRIDSAPRC